MAAVLGAARLFATAMSLLSVMPTVSGDWIPGMVGRRGGAGGLPHHMLAPAVHYGRIGLVAKARAERLKTTAALQDTPTEELIPTRHRLVVCNAYRGVMHLAAIHKRPGRAAIPARWAGEYFVNKTLMSGIPFKTCDVSRMQFKEGDSIVFKVGGTDIGSFNTSGALGVSAGREVSLVLVPYRKLGDMGQGAQFVSHVFRTPKQKGGSQVILADTLKKFSPGALKMEDRSGRLWPVHDDQEVTLQAGTYHFTALDNEGENISSTSLKVATVPKNGVSGKYLVLRMEGDRDPLSGSTAEDPEEFITFSLPVPSSMQPGHSAPPATRLGEVRPMEPQHIEDAPPTVTVAPLTAEEKVDVAKVKKAEEATASTAPVADTVPDTDEALSATQLAATSQQSGSPAAHALAGGALVLAGMAAVF